MSRREQLESMLADSPGDIFLRYALAMELGETDSERSLELHNGLMAEEPPYVPSFFMSGQLLDELDRTEEAIEVLKQGIQQATAQNDSHAAAEMRAFLDTIAS